jgi:F-type H+-transporting ATPase subunit e
MATLPAPRNVSPLIRFGRWSFLLTGIAYGHFHYKYLQRKEVGIQARENKIREKRDARLAEERARSTQIEMDGLAKEAGVIVKGAPPAAAPSRHH